MWILLPFFAKDLFFKRSKSHQLDIETSKGFQQGPEVFRGAKAVGKKWKPFAKKGLKKRCFAKKVTICYLVHFVAFFAKDLFFKRSRSHQLDIETSKGFQQGPKVLSGGQSIWKVNTLCKKGIEKGIFCKKGSCSFLAKDPFFKRIKGYQLDSETSKALKSWVGAKAVGKNWKPLAKKGLKKGPFARKAARWKPIGVHLVSFFAKGLFFKRIRGHQLDIETSKASQQGPKV